MTTNSPSDDDRNDMPAENDGISEDSNELAPTVIGPISSDESESRASDGSSPSDDLGPPLPTGNNHSLPDIDGYVIESALGDGTFGDVFKAHTRTHNLTVAIKVLNPTASGSDGKLERFQRELKAYHNLTHDNVIQYRTNGTCESGHYAGCPFIVMEYMDQGDLNGWLRKIDLNSPAGLHSAIRILSEVCKGLSFLHSRDVVHRDLKPANILLGDLRHMPEQATDYGVQQNHGSEDKGSSEPIQMVPRKVKLADFGLAKYRDDDAKKTQAGMDLGTFAYMPREQMKDAANVTGAADQYAVGVMIYEVICGRRPWQKSPDRNENKEELAARTLARTPVPVPTSETRAVDRRLKDICLRCLEPDPDDRYEHIDHVQEELDAWLNGEPEVRPISRSKRYWNDTVRSLKHRPMRFIVAAIASILLLFGGIWTWQQLAHEWPAVAYYHDVIERWGVFEGAEAMSDRNRRKAAQSYRVQTRGWYGPVVEVSRVNSVGNFVLEPMSIRNQWGTDLDISSNTDDHEECRYVYSYNADGTLKSCKAYSPTGKLLWVRRNISPGLCVFEVDPLLPDDQGNEYAPQELNNGSAATHAKYTFNAVGCKEAVYFQDRRNDAQSNADAIWGYRQQFDPSGKVAVVLYLGSDGKPKRSRWGIAGWKFEAEEQTLRRTLLDENEKPAVNDKGIASVLDQFDDSANLTNRSFYDINNLAVTDNEGVHQHQFQYDTANGARVARSFHSSKPSPTFNVNGVSKILYTVDARLRNVSEKYFGVDNSIPVVSNYGDHEKRRRYDERNRLELEGYFEISGAPTVGGDGAAYVELRYFDSGHQKSQRYFGPNSKPTITREGLHGLDIAIDQFGQETEQRCIGLNGSLCMNHEFFAIKRRTFNERGQMISERFYDAEDTRTTISDGRHGSYTGYDEQGRPIRKVFIGIDDRLTTTTAGTTAENIEYDEHSRDRRLSYFYLKDCGLDEVLDKDGEIDLKKLDAIAQPTLNSEGFHAELVDRDDFGRSQSSTYFDTDNRESVTVAGYSQVRVKRDRLGNVEKKLYYGPGQTPVYEKQSLVHGFDAKFDQSGNRIYERCLGIDEEPVLSSNGFAIARTLYDPRGHETDVRYFDVNDAKTLSKDGRHGYRNSVDVRGNVVRSESFGLDNKPIIWRDGFAIITQKVDSQNRIIKQSVFDAEELPCILQHGWHRQEIEFSREAGGSAKQVRRHFLPDLADGTRVPAVVKDGYSVITEWLDARGNVVRTEQRDSDGQLVLTPTLGCGSRSRFDRLGNLIYSQNIDAEGNGFASTNGIAAVSMVYDDRNREVKNSYFDATGSPTQRTSSLGTAFHSWVKEFNDKDSTVTKRFYADDRGSLLPDGTISVVKIVLDERGREVSTRYYDRNNQAAARGDGAFGWIHEYDQNGNLLYESYVDESGDAINTSDGYAKIYYRRDERGQCLEERYEDASGQLTMRNGSYGSLFTYDDLGNLTKQALIGQKKERIAVDGFSEIRIEYDIFGKENSVSFFGVEEEPVLVGGVHRREYKRDDFGNETEITTWGIDDQLIDGAKGPAEIRIVRNQFGQRESEKYFDAKGAPTVDQQRNAHELKFEYDQFGRRTADSFYGVDGGRVANSGGTHRAEVAYDELGTKTSTWFDADLRKLILQPVLWVYEISHDDQSVDIIKSDGLLLKGDKVADAERALTTGFDADSPIDVKIVRQNRVLQRKVTAPLLSIQLGGGQALVVSTDITSEAEPEQSSPDTQEPASP